MLITIVCLNFLLYSTLRLNKKMYYNILYLFYRANKIVRHKNTIENQANHQIKLSFYLSLYLQIIIGLFGIGNIGNDNYIILIVYEIDFIL